MIKIEAIVREEKMEDVKDALNELDVHGITISQVMGCGTQKGYTRFVRGTKMDIYMVPKIKFEVVVADENCENRVIDAIKNAAFTGAYGDGKVFSYEVRSALRIRTGETGADAILPTDLNSGKA